jgi:hypothetical protein
MSHREESLSTRDLASTPADEPEPAPDPRDEIQTEPPEGGVATADAREEEDTALLPEDQGTEFQGRWESIQTTFVDDPRNAVENADALVAELMQRLADGFARERERLEGQWSRGEDVSTEDLRVVLQRYRSFFRRLLSA